MACDGYTKIWDLAPGELVQLDGARGTTLRVTRGTLWITLEDDVRDVVLSAGDTFTIDRGGLTLVEAQNTATVCVLARHVTEVRRRGEQPGLGSAVCRGGSVRSAPRTATAVLRRTTEARSPRSAKRRCVPVAESPAAAAGRAGGPMGQGNPALEIALGTIPLLMTLLVHGLGMELARRVFETRAIPHYRAHDHAVGYFAATVVIMLFTHLIEIFMWSAVLVGIEAIPGFRDAFFYVATTYTTLGYGEGTLPKVWRLLAPMIAISGLVCLRLDDGHALQPRHPGVAGTRPAQRQITRPRVSSSRTRSRRPWRRPSRCRPPHSRRRGFRSRADSRSAAGSRASTAARRTRDRSLPPRRP